MTVGRKLKRNVFIDTDIDCQNCGCWQRVCTWIGECDNLEPMTNFQRITANEETLAEFIAFTILGKCPNDEKIQYWLEWLKQESENNAM